MTLDALQQKYVCVDARIRRLREVLLGETNHRFVLLRFVGSENGIARPSTLLAAIQNGHGLTIEISPGWRSGLEATDAEYLGDLLAEWAEKPLDEIPALLEQLSELSIGPLGVVEAGIADEQKVKHLLEQVYGNV